MVVWVALHEVGGFGFLFGVVWIWIGYGALWWWGDG